LLLYQIRFIIYRFLIIEERYIKLERDIYQRHQKTRKYKKDPFSTLRSKSSNIKSIYHKKYWIFFLYSAFIISLIFYFFIYKKIGILILRTFVFHCFFTPFVLINWHCKVPEYNLKNSQISQKLHRRFCERRHQRQCVAFVSAT